MRIDARHLWRDVGAHADEPARQRIDDLERLQIEIAAAAGQGDSRCSISGGCTNR